MISCVRAYTGSSKAFSSAYDARHFFEGFFDETPFYESAGPRNRLKSKDAKRSNRRSNARETVHFQ